jgi:hypothetical protein
MSDQILNNEVVFAEDASIVLRDRLELPIFFIVGGADDDYLSRLVGQPIRNLVETKSVDQIPPWPIYGVYASRFLLPSTGYARVFPLSTLLEDKWPILLNIESKETSVKEPTNVERVWIIRALRRAGRTFNNEQARLELIKLASLIRTKMLSQIYPEKLQPELIPTRLDRDSLSRLATELSETQRNYPLIIIVDDLPIQLDKTLGQALTEIILSGCTTDLPAIQTSLELLRK